MATFSKGDKIGMLIEAGLIPADHQLDEKDKATLSQLSEAEIVALQKIKDTLGVDFLSKTSPGKKFPHPLSLTF